MHTKGKWEIGEFYYPDDRRQGTCEVRQDMGILAKVVLPAKGWSGYEEGQANARRIVQCVNSHDDLLEACIYAKKLIEIARQYFPKSIRNTDKFQLENTCAAIGKAIYKAEGN